VWNQMMILTCNWALAKRSGCDCWKSTKNWRSSSRPRESGSEQIWSKSSKSCSKYFSAWNSTPIQLRMHEK
jgi:hypothetical protein